MSERRASPRDVEANFDISELFFSVTDSRGVILSGNSVFQRIAQYSKDQLVGAPHNIIRHPDMPKVVFRLLWKTITKGEKIVAYVKNMARDGTYYWVTALVIPIDDKYISIRLKPSSPIYSLMPDVYKHLLKIEGQKGMDAAEAELVKILNDKGFPTYGAFMQAVLREEMVSRDKLTTEKSLPPAKTKMDESLRSMKYRLHQLFEGLRGFADIGQTTEQKSIYFLEYAKKIKFLAINATLAAQRLGGDGKTLTIVAQQMQKTSYETISSIERMGQSLQASTKNIVDSIFEISMARLQVEMALSYYQELQGIDPSTSEGVDAQTQIDLLLRVVKASVESCMGSLANLRTFLRAFQAELLAMKEVNASVSLVHVTGKVESALVDSLAEFGKTFEELEASVQKSKDDLDVIIDLVGRMASQMKQLESIEGEVSSHLRAVASGGR